MLESPDDTSFYVADLSAYTCTRIYEAINSHFPKGIQNLPFGAIGLRTSWLHRVHCLIMTKAKRATAAPLKLEAEGLNSLTQPNF